MLGSPNWWGTCLEGASLESGVSLEGGSLLNSVRI